MKKQSNYWFFFEPHIHVEIREEDLLFYDTLEHNFRTYEKRADLVGFVKRVCDSDNILKLSGEELEAPALKPFIEELRAEFYCDYLDVTLSEGKPVQLFPMLRIMNGFNAYDRSREERLGEQVTQYLRSLTLFINDECKESCRICSKAYKQVPCCRRKADSNGELSFAEIKGMVAELSQTKCRTLFINGGDIFLHSEIDDIISYLNKSGLAPSYIAHYNNILKAKDRLALMNGEVDKLLAVVPMAEGAEAGEKLFGLKELGIKLSLPITFRFLIENEEQLGAAFEIIKECGLKSYQILPVYSGTNRAFFENNLMINKSMLESKKHKRQDIYTNKTMNINYWGKLTVESDGRVSVVSESPSLGRLGEMTIKEFIYRELDEGECWLKIRESLEGCKKCLYTNFCPPPSNYDLALEEEAFCSFSKVEAAL